MEKKRLGRVRGCQFPTKEACKSPLCTNKWKAEQTKKSTTPFGYVTEDRTQSKPQSLRLERQTGAYRESQFFRDTKGNHQWEKSLAYLLILLIKSTIILTVFYLLPFLLLIFFSFMPFFCSLWFWMSILYDSTFSPFRYISYRFFLFVCFFNFL